MVNNYLHYLGLVLSTRYRNNHPNPQMDIFLSILLLQEKHDDNHCSNNVNLQMHQPYMVD